eukprot:gene5329-6475_t
MSSIFTPPAGNTPARRSLLSVYNLIDQAWYNKETPLTPIVAPSTAQNKISDHAKKLSLSTFEIDVAKAAAMFALNDAKGHFYGNEIDAAETWHNLFTKIKLKFVQQNEGFISDVFKLTDATVECDMHTLGLREFVSHDSAGKKFQNSISKFGVRDDYIDDLELVGAVGGGATVGGARTGGAWARSAGGARS